MESRGQNIQFNHPFHHFPSSGKKTPVSDQFAATETPSQKRRVASRPLMSHNRAPATQSSSQRIEIAVPLYRRSIRGKVFRSSRLTVYSSIPSSVATYLKAWISFLVNSSQKFTLGGRNPLTNSSHLCSIRFPSFLHHHLFSGCPECAL